MADLSERLLARIRNDFPDPGSASEVARLVAEGDSTERVQAAIVIWGNGDVARVRDAHALALTDWRDVLVRAGLEDEDWPAKLDAALGPIPDL